MSTTAAATALPVGMVIGGKYEVLGHLGSGGQATVYRVKDHFLQTEAALKLVDTVSPHRVWQEASMLRTLRGQYILPVLNADLVAGVPYVVTEIARHGSVEDKIPLEGVSVQESIRWTLQATRGISRMHDHGLLHNDLKPGNIFLDNHSNALVGDLGFASMLDATGSADLLGGTPMVMPPEVAEVLLDYVLRKPVSNGRVCTVQSDVFALGASLHWLLAGEPPIRGANELEVMRNAATGTYTSIREVAPHVPHALARVIEKAMSPDARERYSSASEFDYALARMRLPARTWSRIPLHSGHLHCFSGTKHNKITVCAVPGADKSAPISIVSKHASGRRAHSDRAVSPRRLVAELKAVFRNIP